VCRAEINLQS